MRLRLGENMPNLGQAAEREVSTGFRILRQRMSIVDQRASSVSETDENTSALTIAAVSSGRGNDRSGGRRRSVPGPAFSPFTKAAVYIDYGPVPPVWQSEQLTCVRSPISTGCWKAGAAAGVVLATPSVSDIIE